MQGSPEKDKKYLKILFKYLMGKDCNFDNPQSYSEKLQWLKVYDRNPLYTQLVDKYGVRKFIAERIGEEYLIPCLGVWNHFDEIDFDKLPKQFVLKCTHDSGGLVICKDKEKLNKAEAKRKIEHCLKRNYFLNHREWPYKDVEPKIIAEQYVNPTGRFVIGGPHGDSGVTGRKIIVDTYGGCAHHGGGAFSGKDCTKVDRSAAYMARYLAKNIVAVGLAEKCEVQLSYAIGIANPVSVNVNTFGTGKKDDELLAEFIYNNFDLTPSGIIDIFKLRRPIYEQVASYGHFGRTELNLPWEQLDTKKFLGILEV